MKKKKIIAVIPARGGSKRIPHKNIIDFMGKPLIGWTIEAAFGAKIFDRIVVSTDDKKIAMVAEKFGVEVPFLREKYNDDISPVSLATIGTIEQAQKYWNEEYQVVVQLMPNCPIRGSKEIIDSYNHFINKKLSFQISGFKFGWMNPWWAAKLSKDLRPAFIFPGAITQRSQDLEELYCPSGVIWIAIVEKLLKERTFYGTDHVLFPIDWKASVDIDNYDDLEFAQAVYHIKREQL